MKNPSHRGHAVEESGPDVWVYIDTRQPVAENPERECGRCHLSNTPEGHDACLGTLPGVMNACCGHGDQDAAYVQIDAQRRSCGPASLLAIGTIAKRYFGLTEAVVRSVCADLGVQTVGVFESPDWATPPLSRPAVSEMNMDRVAKAITAAGYTARVCECGARPDGTEIEATTGDDPEDQAWWICLACWCAVNYGFNAPETASAERRAAR